MLPSCLRAFECERFLPYVAISFRLCLSYAKNLEGEEKGDSIIHMLYLQVTEQLAASAHPAV